MSSVHNVDGELPETLGSIKSVTDSQEAVMSFYYTDAANQVGVSTHFFVGKFLTCPTLCLSQVKVMEIFDVTQTDPSLLVSDSMGIQYSMDDQVLLTYFSSSHIYTFLHQVLPNDSVSRLRHSSGPSSTFASKSRRNSSHSLGFPTMSGYHKDNFPNLSMSGYHTLPNLSRLQKHQTLPTLPMSLSYPTLLLPHTYLNRNP